MDKCVVSGSGVLSNQVIDLVRAMCEYAIYRIINEGDFFGNRFTLAESCEDGKCDNCFKRSDRRIYFALDRSLRLRVCELCLERVWTICEPYKQMIANLKREAIARMAFTVTLKASGLMCEWCGIKDTLHGNNRVLLCADCTKTIKAQYYLCAYTVLRGIEPIDIATICVRMFVEIII